MVNSAFLIFLALLQVRQFEVRGEVVTQHKDRLEWVQIESIDRRFVDYAVIEFDGQFGFKASEDLSLYGSLSYINSEIQDNIPNAVAGVLATKGKSIYEVPEWQGGVRLQWDPIEALSLGVQGKFVGSRWTNLVNTERFNGYTLWDLDARVKLEQFGLKNTYLQGNVRNLFDERYLGDISPNLTGTAPTTGDADIFIAYIENI